MAEADSLPLAGKRVVVTRAREQAGPLVALLGELGAEVLLLPAVSFAEAEDPAPLEQAIQRLSEFDWLLFTSANAVKFFAKHCRRLGRSPGADGKPLVAAVGPRTAEAATHEDFAVAYVAREFRGAALAVELGAHLAGKKVLLPRSDRASAELPSALRAVGAEVHEVVAYHTGGGGSDVPEVVEAVRRGAVDVISFMSPSAFHNLAELIGIENLRRNAGRVVLAAVGPVTAAAIREAGLTVEIIPAESTAGGLAAAITRFFRACQPSQVRSI